MSLPTVTYKKHCFSVSAEQWRQSCLSATNGVPAVFRFLGHSTNAGFPVSLAAAIAIIAAASDTGTLIFAVLALSFINRKAGVTA